MASWAERLYVTIVSDAMKVGARLRGEDLGRAIRETIEEAARRAKERGNCPHCARRILALLNDDGADRG